MKGLGLGRLKDLEPKPPVRRYQWEGPGDMIQVGTKQLARSERGRPKTSANHSIDSLVLEFP